MADPGAAELNFTDVRAPGIRRRAAGKGWCFLDPEGRPIRCAETRARLLAVALPPAYRDAWYNPDPNGHIQAIARDARGRTQYRYHPDFRAAQEAGKFGSLAAFGAALPAIRQAVTRGLAGPALTRDHVIAAVVRLLDLGQLRVGNEQYARENKSFGATTLRRRHARVEGSRVRLRFRAKGGVDRLLVLNDRHLARAVRRCQDLPGQHLFAWEDAAGDIHPVRSQDVNAWLQTEGGAGITAKQFRTWWASVLALAAIEANPALGLKGMLGIVADQLGNTPAITRKSYVHPQVIAIAKGERPPPGRPRGPLALQPEERRLMALLLEE
jgi:DNA topoisomerase-1